jgi:nucleotide-binding universal stress UspA family protein
MRVLVWIVEEIWPATVAETARFLPPEAEVTLLHVAPADVEAIAHGARHALLGRHHRPPPGPPAPLRAISAEAADALLVEAEQRLGRAARRERRRGRVEREVVDAATGMDLLVLARDGDHPGPQSLGPQTRFVVDHVPCRVLLVWPNRTPH